MVESRHAKLEQLNRLQLRNAIEFIPSVRLDAWELLLKRNPTINELAHIAAKVDFLRETAWQCLIERAPTIEQLKHFSDRFKELRSLIWTEFVNQNVPFDQLWYVPLPLDSASQDRLWTHLVNNHVGSLLNALKYSSLDCNLVPVWTIAVKSSRIAALSADAETKLAFWHGAYLLPDSAKTVIEKIESELDHGSLLQFAEKFFSVDGLARLLLSNTEVGDLVCKHIIESGNDVTKLFQIVKNCPHYRWQAWQKITEIRASGDTFSISLDHEEPSVRETIWHSLFKAPFDTHDLLVNTIPRHQLVELLHRDKHRFCGRLSREQLARLVNDDANHGLSLGSRTQLLEFCFSLALESDCVSRRAKEAWLLFRCAYCGAFHTVELSGSQIVRQAIEEVVSCIRALGIKYLVAKAGTFSFLVQMLVPVLHYDRQTREELEYELLDHCKSDEDLEALLRIAKSKDVYEDAWRRIDQTKVSTASLVQIAAVKPENAAVAWQRILDSLDKDQFWKLLPSVTCLPQNVIQDLQRKFRFDDSELLHLMRYFPASSEEIRKLLRFESGADGLMFVDTTTVDGAEELHFSVAGCTLREKTVTGTCYVFGYSIDPLFDPRWWSSSPLVGSYVAESTDLLMLSMESHNLEVYAEFVLNNSFKHPDFRSVQVVRFAAEAWVEVEVEKVDGTVLGGFITWPNSD